MRRTRRHIGRCTKNLHPENDRSLPFLLYSFFRRVDETCPSRSSSCDIFTLRSMYIGSREANRILRAIRNFRREVRLSAVSFEFSRRANFCRIALQLVGKCEGYDPSWCAIDVASTKTTLSAAAPRRTPSSPALSASLLSDQHIRQRLYLLPHAPSVFRRYDVSLALLKLIAIAIEKKLENCKIITLDFKFDID